MKPIIAFILGSIACFLYQHFTGDKSLPPAIIIGIIVGVLVHMVAEAMP